MGAHKILILFYGVQDTVPPKYRNLAYLIYQAEEIWEVAGTGRTFWLSPEAGHKLSCERFPPFTRRKRASLFGKTKGCAEAPELTGLLRAPQFPAFTVVLSYLVMTSTFHQPSHKTCQVSLFFRSSFPC